MKVLELFAGSRSIGKVAEANGHQVFSLDINDFDGIDLVKDIMDVLPSDIPFVPDMIWASPPCTAFSVACIGRKWVSGEQFTPKTEDAEQGIRIMHKTMAIIKAYELLNKNMVWFVENPRGKMRKSPHWDKVEHDRHTVTYCQYGDKRMKPTDIWTNSKSWNPRPACKNGMPCHTPAPRGSQTGTQGLKGNYERSKIPQELCEEIIQSLN